ncbi:DNA cytosine methyltransferase [Variovorax sp. N23]|uniref:DNA cytosine methyltransferase n=1 Tax=Variovorax sp. N23 TaxID=2980555 RepID=UPI0021C5BBDB|nr:DNA cytosine methyltransferase [Variovorax sp. N23]MCU4119354.1 DNA cytosine methyltransferase [Variovorax sp. N23]
MALHSIELCAGVGMLGEGLRAGLGHLGVETRTVVYVEREAHAAAVLAARIEEGSLDPAPVWSDMLTFDARAWRGAVDCVAAGFPCQDLSLAGRRAGLDGTRSGLFFTVLDIADACGAWLIVLENVAGIASATASVVDEASASDYAAKPDGSGFSDVGIEDGRLLERAAARVVGELADRGWHAEWITLSASDVGASHGRARWFCIAWRMADASTAGWGCPKGRDTSGQRCMEEQGGARRGECGGDAVGRLEVVGGSLADPSGTRCQGRELGRTRACNGGGQEAHGPASELRGVFSPGPADPRWGAILAKHPELAPALEPTFRCVVDGLAFSMGDSRAARLKCVGNGVVALQAGAGIVELVRRAREPMR